MGSGYETRISQIATNLESEYRQLMIFSFGESQHERVEIEVVRYERAPKGEYWDDNWLVTEVRVRAGGFRGNISATIMTGDLMGFLPKLRVLHETLKGEAKFETVEEQISLRLIGDGKGNIELRGQLLDRSGMGNRLNFTLRFDQTQLEVSVRELANVVAHFPVR